MTTKNTKHIYMKKAILRALLSFCVTGMANVFVMLVVSLCMKSDGYVPMLAEFWTLFPSQSMALLTEILLVGVIGAAFGAASVIFEMERLSFLKQGILHFAATTIVWLPISVFVWAVYRYPMAILSMAISYSATYAITWISNAIRIKKMVKEINNML